MLPDAYHLPYRSSASLPEIFPYQLIKRGRRRKMKFDPGVCLQEDLIAFANCWFLGDFFKGSGPEGETKDSSAVAAAKIAASGGKTLEEIRRNLILLWPYFPSFLTATYR
jgi:hypothetical protein